MRRWIPFAALLAVLTLAACTGDDDGPTTDAGSGDSAADDDGDLPLGAGPYPIATLEITVTHPDVDPLTYTVSCLGDTATMTPAAAELDERTACLRLAEEDAQRLLIDGPPPDRICTEIYGGPDESAIVGTIDDRSVNTVITRNNGCGIADWDDTLAGLLPPAVGAT
jgi:hypothetical protein